MKEWLRSLPPIPVTNLLLVIFASVLSLLLLAYLGYLAWSSWNRLDELKLKDRFAARNDFIKTAAQILGGTFFLLTIYFTYQNLAVSQKNLVATQEKNVTDLYTKAIEQLGSKQLEVRLGGIYALERIARDSQKDHWAIMEVLTAYVRNNAPLTSTSTVTPSKELSPDSRKKIPKQLGEQAKEEQPKPKVEIQVVLTILGRTAIPFAQKGEERYLDLHATNLAGSYLNKANLQGAKLSGANLQRADLQYADLQRADLSNAYLQEAVLSGPNLQGAKLSGASLRMADLRYADLQRADLRYANLPGASLLLAYLQEAVLSEANLQGAVLSGANLQGALLSKANLQRANLEGAKLQSANLRGQEGENLGAQGLTAEQVAEADWDETTQWPEGFTPPPRRDVR